MVISTETHESQDFVKPTIMWILVIFSKLVELILISLDQIHYYQVLDKIHWQITQGNVCVWCLSYIIESSEILYKIDHDLTMIDRDIYVPTPVPFYVNFPFSCVDRSSAASRSKNDEILMNCYRFTDTHSKSGARRSSTRKTSDFDRSPVGSLVELPVQ